jgi:hypothetical protein
MDFDVIPADGAFGKEIAKRSAELIQKYNIRAPPVNLFGGIESIPDGLEFQKVSYPFINLLPRVIVDRTELTARPVRCPPARLSTRLRSR